MAIDRSINLKVQADTAKARADIQRLQVQLNNLSRVKLGAVATGRMTQQMGRLGQQTSRTTGAMDKLGARINAAFNIAIVLGFTKALANAGDEMLNITNKLLAVGVAAKDVGAETAFLLRTANSTRTSIGAMATVYSRVKRSVSDLNYTTAQTQKATVAIAQSYQLAGSSAAEATASTIQLAQGLSSGALRGDELRSVLEGNRVLSEAIAKELNVGVGELRALGAEGKITSDIVMRALLNDADNLNSRFAQLKPTFENSFIVLKTGLTAAIGETANILGDALGIKQAFMDAGIALTEMFLDGRVRVYVGEFVRDFREGFAKVRGGFHSLLDVFNIDSTELRIDVEMIPNLLMAAVALPTVARVVGSAIPRNIPAIAITAYLLPTFLLKDDNGEYESGIVQALDDVVNGALNLADPSGQEYPVAREYGAGVLTAIGTYFASSAALRLATRGVAQIPNLLSRGLQAVRTTGMARFAKNPISAVVVAGVLAGIAIDKNDLDEKFGALAGSYTESAARWLGVEGETAVALGNTVQAFADYSLSKLGAIGTVINDFREGRTWAESFETIQADLTSDFGAITTAVKELFGLDKGDLYDATEAKANLDATGQTFIADLAHYFGANGELVGQVDEVGRGFRESVGATQGLIADSFLNLFSGTETKTVMTPGGPELVVVNTYLDKIEDSVSRFENAFGFDEGAIAQSVSNIKDQFNAVKTAVEDAFTNTVEYFGYGVEDSVLTQGIDLAKTAVEGLGNAWTTALNKLREYSEAALSAPTLTIDGNGVPSVNDPVVPGLVPREVLRQASGGYISGPGTATSDSIPAMLSNGEYVIKASSVSKFGAGFMAKINAGIMPQMFNTGGAVGANPQALQRLYDEQASDTSRLEVIERGRGGISEADRFVYEALRVNVAERAADIASLEAQNNRASEAAANTPASVAPTNPANEGPDGPDTGGRKSAEDFAKGFKDDFKSGLSEFLHTGDLKGFLTGLLDSFTSNIINSFVEGFTENLFGQATGEGGWLNNLFKGGISFGESVATTTSKSVSDTLDAVSGEGGFLSNIKGFFGEMFKGIGDLFSGGSGGAGGGLFSGLLGLGGGGGLFSSLFGGSFGSFLGFSQGGIVPNTATSQTGKDSVPAMLMPGEVVLSKNDVSRMGNGSSQPQQTVINLGITGNVDRETRRNVVKMLTDGSIANGVNVYNKERNFR